MKKQLAKLIALLMAVAMLLGAVACSATEDNPVIGKIGKVTIKFSQYQSLFQQYYYYLMNGSNSFDLNDYIKNQLVTYGVTLNRCYVEGIELTEEDEAELDKKVQEQLENSLESYKVDESITDEQEIYDAKLEQLKNALRNNGTSFKKYMADLEKGLREDMLMEKLRDKVYAEITIADEDVAKYFNDNIEDAREKYGPDAENAVNDFYTAYSAYASGTGMIPFYTPEDMFAVKHMYVPFEENADDPKDGTFTEENQALVDETLELIKEGNDTTFEDFEKFVEEKSGDPGMQQEGYIEHGYIMHEDLISKYYDGFGYAAMKLYAGKDWEPPTATPTPSNTPNPSNSPEGTSDPSTTAEPETTAPTKANDTTPAPTDAPDDTEPTSGIETTDAPDSSTPAPGTTSEPTTEPKDYGVEYYTLSDGTEIAQVRSTSGIHFIYIKEILKAGDIEFVDDPENDIWKNIHDFRLKELQEKHYEDCYNDWKAETKIRMKDNYIDQIAARLYGI